MKAAKARKIKYIAFQEVGMSKKDAALAVGYSPSVANSAKSNIETGKTWEELVNEGVMSDESLIKTHQSLLKSKDQRVKGDALKLAYKIKGKIEERHKIGYEHQLEGF